MKRIIAYRVINGHTVQVKNRTLVEVDSVEQVEAFEKKKAKEYTSKTGTPCEVWAVYENL
jgi:hypothetical protein